MEKKQPTFTFTLTFILGELLVLCQSLNDLQQVLLQGCDMQLRTIDLLEKRECQSLVKSLKDSKQREQGRELVNRAPLPTKSMYRAASHAV